MPSEVTIANSSGPIALQNAGLLSILQQMYGTISIPNAVAREWEPTLPAWVQVCPVQNRTLVQSLLLELGAGEAEAIALCQEASATRLILDDKKARRIARQLGLPVTGTLAILLQAKQRGLLPSVRTAVDALVAAQFHISDALIEEVLREAGE